MDPIPHNFYYDPMRQGDGRGVWNWYSGDPFQTGGYLAVISGSGIMYYDCGKGLLSMTLNVPTDATTMDRQWGFKAGDDYVLFDVSNGTFQAKTASTRSQNTGSSTIAWDSAWTGVDTTFMIRWEAGIATFYVNGIKYAQISDASIPYGPLSPFIFTDGADLFLIKSVVGQGMQTLILNPVVTSGDAPEPMGIASDSLTVSESVTILQTRLVNVYDSLTIAENITKTLNEDDSEAETITVTEVITMGPPAVDTGSINDTSSVDEDLVVAPFDAADLSIDDSTTLSDLVVNIDLTPNPAPIYAVIAADTLSSTEDIATMFKELNTGEIVDTLTSDDVIDTIEVTGP